MRPPTGPATACDQAVGRHGEDAGAGEEETDGDAGQDGVAAGQRADNALLEAGQLDGGDTGFDRRAILAADAAKDAFAAPQPHRHHVVDANRKAAVDVGDLRQIGDVMGGKAVALDAAGKRLEHADDRLEQGRFAGTVGPTTTDGVPRHGGGS